MLQPLSLHYREVHPNCSDEAEESPTCRWSQRKDRSPTGTSGVGGEEHTPRGLCCERGHKRYLEPMACFSCVLWDLRAAKALTCLGVGPLTRQQSCGESLSQSGLHNPRPWEWGRDSHTLALQRQVNTNQCGPSQAGGEPELMELSPPLPCKFLSLRSHGPLEPSSSRGRKLVELNGC